MCFDIEINKYISLKYEFDIYQQNEEIIVLALYLIHLNVLI